MAEAPVPKVPAPDAVGEPAAAAGWRPLLKLSRPRQWTKNSLLFAALIFAERLFDAEAVVLALLAFAAFCLASSSVYIVNDWVDADRDRLHPDKRQRPIASGQVSKGFALVLAVALTAVSLGLAFEIGVAFGAWTVGYLLLSHFYSFVGKNIVVLDVMLIASGFVIRAVAGAVAIEVPVSDWFILCTLFAAVFLATCKRKAELRSLEEGAGNHRPVLDRYTESSLTAFTATSMASALISYALYVMEEIRGRSDAAPELLPLTVPFVMFGLFRYYLLVETDRGGDKPEEVLLRDRPMQACITGFALVAVAALYLGG